jgi:cobalt-zinc-cadmium efflux system outer membrane protein
MRPVSILAAVTLLAASPGGRAQPAPEPKGSLTLAEAIALSLGNSPSLAAERYGVRAAEALSIRARFRPNPEAGVEVENLPSSRSSTGADETEITLRLSQVIELGGKRAARMAEARAANDLAAWDYEIRRLDVLADTARNFIEVVSAQELLALAEEAMRLAQSEREAVKTRINAARASSVEMRKSDIAVANAEIEQEHRKHALLSVKKTLAAAWGSETAAFTSAKADLYARQRLEAFGSLMARIGSNPDIARFAGEISLREAQLRLARTKGVPDVTVTAGVRQFASENAWAGVFGVSLPLPLFDRGQADVYEALQEQSKAEAMGQAIRVGIAAQLFATYQEAAHAITELGVLAKEILPAAREVLTATEEGYRQGRFSYLELADARRSLIELRRRNIDAARNYHLYQLEIDRLIGAAALAPKTFTPPKKKN